MVKFGTFRVSVGAFLRDTTGLVTAEFVGTLPLILCALAISFDFGRSLWAHQIVAKDLRDAARYLSRVDIYNAAAVTDARAIARTGALNSAGAAAHFPWTLAGATFDVSGGAIVKCPAARPFTNANFRVSGQSISVCAQVPLSFGFLQFLNRFISTDVPIAGTIVMWDEARYIGD